MKFIALKTDIKRMYYEGLLPYDRYDVGEDGTAQHLKGYPTSGFPIEIPYGLNLNGELKMCYDTDLDPRLNEPKSEWLCMPKEVDVHGFCGRNMKRKVEKWLMDFSERKGDIRVYDKKREPLTISGDDAEAFREFMKTMKKKEAAETAGAT